MKVLLSEDVVKLGKRGEVKEVSPGFARNYLFPRKLAIMPTADGVRQVEAMKRKAAMKEAKELESMKLLRDEILKRSITIEMKANEQGHLFGAVNTDIISEAFKKEGLSVAPSAIQLAGPIKDLGIYEIEFKLHNEVSFKSKVWVVAPAPEVTGS